MKIVSRTSLKIPADRSGRYAAIPTPPLDKRMPSDFETFTEYCSALSNHQLDGYERFDLLKISLVLFTERIGKKDWETRLKN